MVLHTRPALHHTDDDTDNSSTLTCSDRAPDERLISDGEVELQLTGGGAEPDPQKNSKDKKFKKKRKHPE